ncbi:MAG: lipid-binding SYLF domain-containing protein [Pirellulales bacterium]|jgi:lipid-binding SYLF domain-containing protein|nr:lipid-binding SYLF domain-containing protein [Thermoguttaceae bacterium]MDD4787702.1 lipid-binding SYLF domain-containing protein [Pirellulales bacterium]NLZ00373.1 lipid-binding SYLF domain-containing protein [Pirellulaceae bacterium]
MPRNHAEPLTARFCLRCLPCLLLVPALALGQTLPPGLSKEESIVRTSISVLSEIMAVPVSSIPESMLAEAEGLAIIPNMIKGGFVVGVRHGRGVLLVRDEKNDWHAPVFISMTGGNIGWQIGLQATDVVLVFKTRQSVQGILGGKFTLGADAAAAAGPVGRQASAGTDGRLKAEIYSYSRSRGLFAGVSIDGSVIQIDQAANASYYLRATPGGPVVVPPSAATLVGEVTRYCGGGQPHEPKVLQTAGLAPHTASGQADAIRGQLARKAPLLASLLDPQWAAYLALPSEVVSDRGHPPIETLSGCLARFETVHRTPEYASLAQRPEFQSVYNLLRQYSAALSPAAGQMQLPPPPK